MIRNEGRRDARKAIVIVTDDQTERERNVEAVERALTRADAVLMALIAPDAMRSGRQRGGYPGGSPGGVIFGPSRRYPGYPGGGQAGTRPAGTDEIARASGGDSARVNDPYALQDTLARIRQSYAIYFDMPPGVRAGDERDIDLELAEAELNRYPGASIHYRRTYYASSGSAAVSDAGPAPAFSDDPDRPHLQRRPAVSPRPAGSYDGPLDLGGAASGPRPAPPQTAAPPAPAPPPAASPADPNAPGWRKARPDELPH